MTYVDMSCIMHTLIFIIKSINSMLMSNMIIFINPMAKNIYVLGVGLFHLCTLDKNYL
jgi:hypothetical protein